MIETTDIVGPISGCITPLPVDALKPFLDGHRAALPPMPDLTRDESVLEIAPEHQEFFSELRAKAEALGAGDALERAMQRCINYADNRVDYKCVLAPSSDAMSFTAQPMTKGRKTNRREWDRIIFFGVIFDREAKEWRFHF